MIRQLKQKNSGFTLVEILVYIAILLIVSTSSVAFLFSLDDLLAQYRLETELYRSGTNVLEQVTLSLRQADAFDVIGTIEDDPDGALSVIAGATTTVFSRSGDDLELSINGIDYGDMLSGAVDVTNFTVYKYDTAIGEFVRIKLVLSATVAGVTKGITLYGGSVIRGSL